MPQHSAIDLGSNDFQQPLPMPKPITLSAFCISGIHTTIGLKPTSRWHLRLLHALTLPLDLSANPHRFCYPFGALIKAPSPPMPLLPLIHIPAHRQWICHQTTTKDSEMGKSESTSPLFRFFPWKEEPNPWVAERFLFFGQLWTPQPPSASSHTSLPHHFSAVVPASQNPGKLVGALVVPLSLECSSPRSLHGWLSLGSLLKVSPSLRGLPQPPNRKQSGAVGDHLWINQV